MSTRRQFFKKVVRLLGLGIAANSGVYIMGHFTFKGHGSLVAGAKTWHISADPCVKGAGGTNSCSSLSSCSGNPLSQNGTPCTPPPSSFECTDLNNAFYFDCY